MPTGSQIYRVSLWGQKKGSLLERDCVHLKDKLCNHFPMEKYQRHCFSSTFHEELTPQWWSLLPTVLLAQVIPLHYLKSTLPSSLLFPHPSYQPRVCAWHYIMATVSCMPLVSLFLFKLPSLRALSFLSQAKFLSSLTVPVTPSSVAPELALTSLLLRLWSPCSVRIFIIRVLTVGSSCVRF